MTAAPATVEAPPDRLALDGELTIYRAAECREQLRASLADGAGDLLLDLSRVSEIDSAGVQLLMAAKKSADAAGRRLRLVDHSPAVLEVFETLDLAAHFGDPLLVMPTVATEGASHR